VSTGKPDKVEKSEFNPLRFLILVPSVATVLFITAVLVAVFQVITLFRLRNMCCRYIVRPCSRILLRLFGITYAVHSQDRLSDKQKIYLFNHTSRIDVALLPAICFDRTRYFMSKRTYKFLPVTIINIFIGTFLIDQQHKPQKRIACFKRAEAILRKTGESVILSPEGTTITTGRISKFNKGAFHLATNMKVPIVPVYFYIPPEIDPGAGYRTLGGHTDVYVLPEVDTSNWTLDDLDKNRQMVRNVFVDYHNKMHGVSYD
jgi:1-acyl-sn-glycerol-3-phosphate acyltransferase